jgi:ADP-ribose pyrophosphatase
MSGGDIEIVEKIVAYQGYGRIDRYRLRHRQHAGGLGPVISREVLERGQVAAVLPVDPKRDRVVLIEQFRPGAYAAGMDPWLLECVAGIIEDGESAEEMARREALEEAGCEVAELVPMHHVITSPGACSETIHLFAGRIDSRGIGGIHGLPEEGEDILVRTYGVDEAVRMLDEGRIVNAKTIIALHWLARHYTALKSDWLDRTPG